MRNPPFKPSHFHCSGSTTSAVTLPADAGLPPDFFDKLPIEIILQVLKSLYPPAAVRPFDYSTIRHEETGLHEHLNDPHKPNPIDAWRERLNYAHKTMANLILVSRRFKRHVAAIQKDIANLILYEKDAGTVHHVIANRLRESYPGPNASPSRVHQRCWGSDFDKALQWSEERMNRDKAEKFNRSSWLDIASILACRAWVCGSLFISQEADRSERRDSDTLAFTCQWTWFWYLEHHHRPS